MAVAFERAQVTAAANPSSELQTPSPGGSLRGRVFVEATDTPLPGAEVLLEAAQARGGLASSVRRAMTDAAGAFDFAEVASGQYLVSVRKSGYLLRGSDARPSGSPLRVTVDAGPTASVLVPMIRAGAIEGRIVGRFGEPVAQLRVHVEQYRYGPDGARTLVPAGVSDDTDDLGQFRVYGLPAGDFIVVAGGTFTTLLGGGVRASVPFGDVVARSDGTFSMQTTGPPLAARIYSPGTASPAEAQIVSLRSGQEATVSFSYVPASLRTVRGTALLADGRPAAGSSVTLRASPSVAMATRSAGTVSTDGTFAIGNVPPGPSWIEIASNQAGERGSVPIFVDADADLEGVAIVTGRGSTIRGHVRFEGTRPGAFQVRARRVDAVSAAGVSSAAVAADGRFEFRDVLGPVVLEAGHDDWIASSVIVDGREMVEDPVEAAGPEAIGDVQMVVSNRLTSLAGRVTDGNGRALPGRSVVLLRTDRETAIPAEGTRVLRTDADGRYDTRGMRPGSYVVGVPEDLEPGYQFSPALQHRLRVRGHQLTLDSGAAVVMDLTPAPGL